MYHRFRYKKDPAAGKAIFLANCAPCHGQAARGGGRGPALVGRELVHGSSESEILTVVRNGVAGSSMPGFAGSPDEENSLVAYLRSIVAPTSSGNGPHTQGNADRGAAVYAGSGCAGCHLIGDEGSVFGPELTRVGSGRSHDYLKQSLLDPSAEIATDEEGVTLTTSDGRRVTGILVNEDTFTVQVRDATQRFVSFDKSDLKAVTHETKSLMPGYAALPAQDLEDLLAYLLTLRGAVMAGAEISVHGLR